MYRVPINNKSRPTPLSSFPPSSPPPPSPPPSSIARRHHHRKPGILLRLFLVLIISGSIISITALWFYQSSSSSSLPLMQKQNHLPPLTPLAPLPPSLISRKLKPLPPPLKKLKQNSLEECDDLYEAICADSTDDKFHVLYDQNRLLAKDLILDAPIHSTNIGKFYESCRHFPHPDESEIFNDLLNLPLETYEDLISAFVELQRYDVITPIEVSFEMDLINGRHLIILLRQSGLFVENKEDLYSSEHLEEVQIRLHKTGKVEDSIWGGKMVVKIEKALESIMQHTDAHNIFEYVVEYAKRDRFVSEWDGSFEIYSFIEKYLSIKKMHFDQRPLWIYSKSYFEYLKDVLEQFSMDAWRVYLIHSLYFSFSGGLETDYAYHSSYDPRYSLPWNRPRRFVSVPFDDGKLEEDVDDCVFITEAYLPVILDEQFVDALHTRANVVDAQEIVFAVKREIEEMVINEFSIFTEEERAIALRKIQSAKAQIGMPSYWPRDERSFSVTENSFVENALIIRRYHTDYMISLYLKHLQDEVEPWEVFDGSLTIANAFYQHQLNTLTINAGLLRPPMFNDDVASRYARFGMFVGHELGHSLDRMGLMFDEHGSINPWVSRGTMDKYEKKSKCFVDLFNSPTKFGNQHNGVKTLNENIADSIGYEAAFRAYKKMEGGDERSFYLAYTETFCGGAPKKSSSEKQTILKSVHSLANFRVNKVVMQRPEFYNYCVQRNQTVPTLFHCDIKK